VTQIEASLGGAAHVVVDAKRSDGLWEHLRGPAPATHEFDLIGCQIVPTQVVALRTVERPEIWVISPILERLESVLRAVCVVPPRIGPEHNRSPDAEELAGHHDLVTVSFNGCDRVILMIGRGTGGRENDEGERDEEWQGAHRTSFQ